MELEATEYRQSGTNEREATTRDRVDVTPHTLTVEAAGHAPWSASLTIDGPRSEDVDLE